VLSGEAAAGFVRNGVCWAVGPEKQGTGARFEVGLCANCAYARRVESARGSVFYLCELSASNPQFPKYPRLPVLECFGYAKRNEARVGPERREKEKEDSG
jgi:hypothetical protein